MNVFPPAEIAPLWMMATQAIYKEGLINLATPEQKHVFDECQTKMFAEEGAVVMPKTWGHYCLYTERVTVGRFVMRAEITKTWLRGEECRHRKRK